MRRCTMMAHLRLMTLSLMVMPACQRASRRPSNAARSCARRGPARNVLFCLQTLKNGTLTHPSLWEDYCSKMLSLAGAHPRDYAVLQVFLQTGIRVSELASLRITDIDFIKPSITVRGKGSVEREIALEEKGIHALKSYLALRPESVSQRVFLNYQGEPISERGIRKLVVKYRKEAGITKKASCHTLRHTFATYKAEKGVSAYQLQQWLGHANLNTTQIYVHLGKQNARKIMQNTSLP